MKIAENAMQWLLYQKCYQKDQNCRKYDACNEYNAILKLIWGGYSQKNRYQVPFKLNGDSFPFNVKGNGNIFFFWA